MGGVHLLVETAARDVTEILRFHKAHAQVQAEVNRRMEQLLRASMANLEFSQVAPQLPSEDVVRCVVLDLMKHVIDSEIPKLQVLEAEKKAAALQQEVSTSREEVVFQLKEQEILHQRLEHHEKAREYMMQTYFREVATLRHHIADLQQQLAASREEVAQLSSSTTAVGPLGSFAASTAPGGGSDRDSHPASACSSGGPSSMRRQHNVPPSRTQPYLLNHHAKQLVSGAGGGGGGMTRVNPDQLLIPSSNGNETAGNGDALTWALSEAGWGDGAGGNDNGGCLSPLAAAPQRSDLQVDCGHSKGGSGVFEVDALFDYEKYVSMQKDLISSWPERYEALQKKFADTVAQMQVANVSASIQANKALAGVQATLREREATIATLTQFVRRFHPIVMTAVREAKLALVQINQQVRRDLRALQKDVTDWAIHASEKVAEAERRFQLLLSFVRYSTSRLAHKLRLVQDGTKVRATQGKPLWQFFLLTGKHDPFAEAKVFWQDREEVKDLLDVFKNLMVAAERISNSVFGPPSDEEDLNETDERDFVATAALQAISRDVNKSLTQPAAKRGRGRGGGAAVGRGRGGGAGPAVAAGRGGAAAAAAAPRTPNRVPPAPQTATSAVKEAETHSVGAGSAAAQVATPSSLLPFASRLASSSASAGGASGAVGSGSTPPGSKGTSPQYTPLVPVSASTARPGDSPSTSTTPAAGVGGSGGRPLASPGARARSQSTPVTPYLTPSGPVAPVVHPQPASLQAAPGSAPWLSRHASAHLADRSANTSGATTPISGPLSASNSIRRAEDFARALVKRLLDAKMRRVMCRIRRKCFFQRLPVNVKNLFAVLHRLDDDIRTADQAVERYEKRRAAAETKVRRELTSHTLNSGSMFSALYAHAAAGGIAGLAAARRFSLDSETAKQLAASDSSARASLWGPLPANARRRSTEAPSRIRVNPSPTGSSAANATAPGMVGGAGSGSGGDGCAPATASGEGNDGQSASLPSSAVANGRPFALDRNSELLQAFSAFQVQPGDGSVFGSAGPRRPSPDASAGMMIMFPSREVSRANSLQGGVVTLLPTESVASGASAPSGERRLSQSSLVCTPLSTGQGGGGVGGGDVEGAAGGGRRDSGAGFSSITSMPPSMGSDGQRRSVADHLGVAAQFSVSVPAVLSHGEGTSARPTSTTIEIPPKPPRQGTTVIHEPDPSDWLPPPPTPDAVARLLSSVSPRPPLSAPNSTALPNSSLGRIPRQSVAAALIAQQVDDDDLGSCALRITSMDKPKTLSVPSPRPGSSVLQVIVPTMPSATARSLAIRSQDMYEHELQLRASAQSLSRLLPTTTAVAAGNNNKDGSSVEWSLPVLRLSTVTPAVGATAAARRPDTVGSRAGKPAPPRWH